MEISSTARILDLIDVHDEEGAVVALG